MQRAQHDNRRLTPEARAAKVKRATDDGLNSTPQKITQLAATALAAAGFAVTMPASGGAAVDLVAPSDGEPYRLSVTRA